MKCRGVTELYRYVLLHKKFVRGSLLFESKLLNARKDLRASRYTTTELVTRVKSGKLWECRRVPTKTFRTTIGTRSDMRTLS